MKQLHEGFYTVSDALKYRKLVESRVIFEECLIRGNKLLSLKEVETGKWEYVAELNLSNPRLDELATLLPEKFDINYTLASVPKITPISIKEIAKRALEEQAA